MNKTQFRRGVAGLLIAGTVAIGSTGIGSTAEAAQQNISQSDIIRIADQLGIDFGKYGIDINQLFGSIPQLPSYGNGQNGNTEVTQPDDTATEETGGGETGTVDPGNTTGNEGNAGNEGTTAVDDQGSAYAAEVVNLVNAERAKSGLSPLASDSALANVALAKAKDMYNNGYFSHTSPTYGSPFDMMTQFGIQYSYAGENIAKGQRTSAEVMQAWMNSQGHRDNIMNANYAKIGVAYYNGVWVQMFIK